jgi:hypothetical protein
MLNKEFLNQIPDWLVEKRLQGLALKICLLFLNINKHRPIMYLSTLESLLAIRNRAEIKKALEIIYSNEYARLIKEEKKGQRTRFYWEVAPKLREQPFFSIPANHVAVCGDDGTKRPGRIMNLSGNGLRLWLWLHREFSRRQIGGHDFQHSEGYGCLEFKVKDAEGELGFRIHTRLLEALEKDGLLRVQETPEEGMRTVLLAQPHFKPSAKPGMGKGLMQSAVEVIRSAPSSRSMSVGSISPGGYAANYPRESVLVMDAEPDPGLQQECMDLVGELGLRDRDAAGIRRLIRKYDSYTVMQSIRTLEKSGQEITLADIGRESKKIFQEKGMQRPFPCWEENDEGYLYEKELSYSQFFP